MSQTGVFSDGNDVDFDKLNDEYLSKQSLTEKVKGEIGAIDTNRIFANEAYDQLSSVIDKSDAVRAKSNEPFDSETPKQKFDRIKIELTELQEDLETLSKEQNTKENQAFTAVFAELNSLQAAVNEIYKDPAMKAVIDDETLQTLSEEEKILALKAKKNTPNIQKLFDDIKNAKSSGDSANLNLKLDSRDEKIKLVLIFEDLNRRAKCIQTFIGENKNVLNDIQKYRNISKFIDENERSILSGRVMKVSKDLEQVVKKQKNYQDMASGIDVKKLMDLNTGYNKIKKQNDEVPIIFDRLESLKNIHEESANLTLKIQTLKETQNALISKLRNNNELLAKIDTNLTGNLNVIKENIVNLDERLKKLGK